MDHDRWMKRALELALQGEGHVHPNPMVGCVIVKGNKLIAGGCHRAFGQAHAEVEALRQAGSKARGATLYINLEPCVHWGKTPPCVEAIDRAGVKEVVIPFKDPNPLVKGKGIRYLRRNGITVRTGILENEARELNRAFIWWMQKKRPYVTLKIAASLDGKIAAASGESRWITGTAARREGHRMRAQADAVAVGIETVLKDNPRLTSHGFGRNPCRVIFDSRLRIPASARALDSSAQTIIFTSSRSSASQRRRLEKPGTRVIILRSDSSGRLSLHEALKRLGEMDITHLMVEGGGRLLGSFLREKLANEVVWFAAPILIGHEGRSAVGELNVKKLSSAWHLKNIEIKMLGQDLCIKGKF
jgi:diaminohydroxyphosphoribosylaminopyrimidine deaminase/5-amino-6-(5-phosphoribosylamino)uracil reductase